MTIITGLPPTAAEEAELLMDAEWGVAQATAAVLATGMLAAEDSIWIRNPHNPARNSCKNAKIICKAGLKSLMMN